MSEFDLKAGSVQGARIVGDLCAETTAARRHLETKRSPESSWPLFFSNKPPNFTYYLNTFIFSPWLLLQTVTLFWVPKNYNQVFQQARYFLFGI